MQQSSTEKQAEQLHDTDLADNADKWRSLVIVSVNEILSDVSKVKNAELHSHLQTALEFILNATNRFPEIFFPPLDAYWTDQESDSGSEWQKLLQSTPYELTCWIIRHLLRIISVPGSNEVQEKAQSIVLSLLNAANGFNHFCFGSLSAELISALEDLSEFYVKFFGEAGVNYSATLTRFSASRQNGRPLDSSLKPGVIDIKEPEICEQLQIAITRILSGQTIYLSFYETLVDRFWKIINSQLENGEVTLKTASLELARQLLKLSVPESHRLECYCECLVALTCLLCSGFSDCDGDFNILEMELAEALTQLVTIVGDASVLASDHLIILRYIHFKFLNMLIVHGASRLRTSQLCSAICGCVMHSMRHLPSSVVSFTALSDVYREGLCRRLLKELGSVPDSQCIVSLMRQVTILEFSELFADQSGDRCETLRRVPVEAVVSPLEKNGEVQPMEVDEVCSGSTDKPPTSWTSGVPVLADKSTVVAILVEHLCILSASVAQMQGLQDVLQCIRGQSCILEIVAGCFVLYEHLWESKLNSEERTYLLHQEQLREILASWFDFFGRYSLDLPPDEFLSGYHIIVAAIGALVYANDVGKMNSEDLHSLVGILSLPWLCGELSWIDLKVSNQKQLLTISEKFWDKIDTRTIGECVQILSVVTRQCAPKWRTTVFRKAFGDAREDVRASVVSNIPALLHCLGPSSHSVLPEVVCGSLLDNSELIAETLASTLSSIVCVVSGQTKLIRNPLADEKRLGYQAIALQCKGCARKSDDGGEKSTAMTQVKPPKFDITVFLKFTKLLSSGNRTVKLNLIGCFHKLFDHLWLWKNDDLSLEWLSAAFDLLQDPDYEVRIALSKVVKYLVVRDDDLMPKINEVMMSKLSALEKTMATGLPSVPLVETMILIAGEIGKVAEGELLLKAVTVLLNVIIFPLSLILESVALQQLRFIAKEKNVSLRLLFLQFGHQICQAIADCLHETKKNKPDWDPSEVFQKVADVFGFHDVQTFLRRTEHWLLPHLVRKASPTSSALLKCISRLIDDPNHKNVIMRTINPIFCHLICSIEQQSELAKVLKYLEKETEWGLSKLLACGTNVESVLLVHLSSYYHQVLHGVKICLEAKGVIQDAEKVTTDRELAEVLRPTLLGFLVNLDKLLNDGTVPLNEKKKAYKSLIKLMELFGSQHITRVRMRVITTLKIGLKFKDRCFTELCCEGWNSFVHLLELPALGPMLCQIVVNLLPLLQLLPSKVADILHYLIVQNREGIHKHLHELYFIPDLPVLTQVNAVLKQYVEGQYSCKDLRTQIENLLKGISHELLDVRQMALTRMKQLLGKNKNVLHDMILENETSDPIISQIVIALMQGCRESDPTIRNLVGECLGELGAIDPSRLELMSDHQKTDPNRIFLSVMDEGFAFEFINELTKAFLRAEDRTAQDCVAYALQDLIQIYNIEVEGRSNAAGAKLWRQFSPEVQEILMPLTQSRYKLNIVLNWSGLSRPIYQSPKGRTFEQWLCTLAGYLESKVTEEKSKRVFEACRGVINQDRYIALHLLPYLVLQVLVQGSPEDHAMLLVELNTVLSDAKQDEVRYGSPSDLRHLSAQTVFSVLDYLTKWIRQYSMMMSLKPPAGGAQPQPEDRGFMDLKAFMRKVPKDVLAIASYNCGAVTRAVMHHEHFMRLPGTFNCKQENLDFLLKLYLALDEPDGVAGIIAIQQNQPSLAQQILAFESVGQLSDASVCYNLTIQTDPNDITYRQGLLKNRLALGELNSALDLANGMITENSEWTSLLNTYRVEAAWKLGQWDKLETYLCSDESRDWNTGLGRVLLAAKLKDEKSLNSSLMQLRQEQMAPLSAASMEVRAYPRGYEYVIRLHMLKELEEGLKIALGLTSLVNQESCNSSSLTDPLDENAELSAMIRRWQGRLEFTQASYRIRSPILDLQRVILTLAKEERQFQTDHEIGICWLESARMARKCGLIQTAHSQLLSAADYKLPEFCIEKAKWLWDKGDFDQARSCLEKAVDQLYPDRSIYKSQSGAEIKAVDRLACAKALLQLSRYNEETSSCESNTIMRQFKEVKEVNKEWEDGYFYTAKYYDKIMTTVIENDKLDKRGEFITQVISHFGQSLCFGNQYIYQSMPRMLTLWLDFGAEVVASDDKPDELKQSMRQSLASMNKMMQDFCRRLAPYQFLVSFPQLISRICHAHPEVFFHLREIIANLLKEFPQQAMWMMMAVSKSSYPMRVKRCQEIFHKAKTLKSNFGKFLQDATRLTDRLLDLCNRPVEGPITTLSISQNFKPLQRLLEDPDLSLILLPLQSQMLPKLPSMPVAPSTHVPFSSNQIFIKGLEDTVEVLASLQKPKKITFRGSDGKLYIMLCKPKDDLRKDARLMEFTSIVNRCLRRDADSRRRDLHIRTFTVTPLNEECGLLEWVSNVHGLRPILLKLYREKGTYMSGKELKSLQLPPNAYHEKKLQMYKTKLLPRHPAVFSDWFLRSFPDPTSWYNARLAYCRTTAVMSMVGYILGLGDRHGENILIDATMGDCLHVDFNCLFNKGETFDYPEIVPFRLTHNMIEAMGPLGFEGIFRRACEVTMRVMRDQKDPLMSVLKTFIYDPLVEWSKPARGRGNPTESGEIRNEKAQTHVDNIENRLRGILKSKSKSLGLPLSVEGNVSYLIKEATDVGNLCQMYIGWAAYM